MLIIIIDWPDNIITIPSIPFHIASYRMPSGAFVYYVNVGIYITALSIRDRFAYVSVDPQMVIIWIQLIKIPALHSSGRSVTSTTQQEDDDSILCVVTYINRGNNNHNRYLTMYMGKSKISVAHALFIIDTYDSATSNACIHGCPPEVDPWCL